MLKVVLTGGIGSGKTAVTNIFRQLGKEQSLKLIDSDQIARALLQGSLNNSPSKALLKVQELFGSELFNSSGELNRAKLRELIFSSPDKKQQLETLLHPLVYQNIAEKLAEFRQQGNIHIVITDIPLFFETAFKAPFKTKNSHLFDRILVVDIPENLQIARSMQRDHCSRALIQKIIASQVDRHIRLSQADDIIDNSGTLQQLHEQVEKLYLFYQTLVH